MLNTGIIGVRKLTVEDFSERRMRTTTSTKRLNVANLLLLRALGSGVFKITF
jgi:hypothetical protein